MKPRASSEKYDVVAEINMIPFIDIALVLLIIFMVMTPFLVKEQIKINLPKTRSANTQVDKQRLMQINISAKGEMTVDGDPVTADTIQASIEQHLKDPETQPVVIAADKDVTFEKVVVAMDAAKRAGAKQLGVSVRQDDKAGGGTRPPAKPKHKTRP
jgi:biopolymer transport protein ExbD